MSQAFEIKTEAELAEYGNARSNNSVVSTSQWNKLFAGQVTALGYKRVVRNEAKGYDNRISPPQSYINKAKVLNKKIKIQTSECKKFFTITLVDVAA